MQILIDELVRPWGIEQQIGLLARWARSENKTVRILTGKSNLQIYGDIKKQIKISTTPWKDLEPDEPTLVGPYPATSWITKSSVRSYSVLLSEIPWGLHPKKQTQWLGAMPSYVHGSGDLIKESLKYLLASPLRWAKTRYNRWRHEQGLNRAETIYIFDNRLKNPVQEIYGQTTKLLTPSYPCGRSAPRPQGYYLCVTPLEPARNLHAVIDAFYLLVRRYGARFQANWDLDSPFQSGDLHDFQLKIIGEGSGKSYLEQYAQSQQMSEKLEFIDWPPPEELQRYLEGAIGVIDVPLTGDASSLVYRAIAGGVPAVYSRSHPGLDSLITPGAMAKQVKPSNRDEIAKGLIEFAQISTDQRKPDATLKKGIDPENVFQTLINPDAE